MRKLILSLALMGFAWSAQAQSTSNESLSLQACQGDTIVFGFNITSPFNIGNTFSVEMSDASGNFAGNFVSINALLAYGVSSGNEIDVLVPDNTTQGVYKFRMISSNPVVISDTISNVIIGANPETRLQRLIGLIRPAKSLSVKAIPHLLVVANAASCRSVVQRTNG